MSWSDGVVVNGDARSWPERRILYKSVIRRMDGLWYRFVLECGHDEFDYAIRGNPKTKNCRECAVIAEYLRRNAKRASRPLS